MTLEEALAVYSFTHSLVMPSAHERDMHQQAYTIIARHANDILENSEVRPATKDKLK